jgi:hypothetical protein
MPDFPPGLYFRLTAAERGRLTLEALDRGAVTLAG